tara:strand:+ start:112 stop:1266 length:1155 start_codon:yes stop_codon:yes gene_type:complete
MNKIFRTLLVIVFSLLSESTFSFSDEKKIRIGLLVPLSGENSEIGKQIVNSTRMALNDINSDEIEIYPKDTQSDPNKTLNAALEFEKQGINLVIGPIFYKNLIYLNEVKSITFLSLTNQTLDLPKNIISAGINSTSQLNTIKKFIDINEIKKTIFLIPSLNYDLEIKRGIKNSKIKVSKTYSYNIEPTKLTKQIEKITNYEIRKQNLIDEITRIEKSDDPNKKKKIEKLEKRYTLGSVRFDSVVIADFEESLKSVVTSLIYTDVSPKKKYIITFNQWFDDSLIKETSLQPIYYPSINKKNLDDFKIKFFNEFNLYPNHLSLLSYDLVGLIYYLSLQNEVNNKEKFFKSKNTFKGKIGIFDIKDNKINHRLNFYQIDQGLIKKVF